MTDPGTLQLQPAEDRVVLVTQIAELPPVNGGDFDPMDFDSADFKTS